MIYDKAALTRASVVLWILDNNFKTEKGYPVEFTQHRWAIDYLADSHPHKVATKAAQAGMTFLEFLDDIYLVGVKGLEVAHTFHTDAILQKIVRPKLNPLIANNLALQRLMTSDSEGLKGFGRSFLHVIGANSESNAISFSADVLKIDEKDRSDLGVVEMLESRLKASKVRWIREFSNPSAVGIGVDASWRRSDQRHWLVKCRACSHRMYIDFEPGELRNHYVDQALRQYVCGGLRSDGSDCRAIITDTDRINGEWVAKWAEKTSIHGYWISQLMCPWISAEDIMADYESKSVEYFYNFVLGKAYTPTDLLLDREAILRACRPGVPFRRGVVMGSDIGRPHWYWLGNSGGVFETGKASSWEDLERIFLANNCDAWVADAQPEFTEVQRMIRKYPGKFYACRYVPDTKSVGIVRWQTGELSGFVYADRTKIIDRLVQEITSGSIRFLTQPAELEDFIAHAGNMYRRVETDEKGKTNIDWITIGKSAGESGGAKRDDSLHALVYWRIALELSFGGAGFVNDTHEQPTATVGAVKDGKFQVKFDIEESLERARNGVVG